MPEYRKHYSSHLRFISKFVADHELLAEGLNIKMPFFFKCQPVPDLLVIPISNISTRACLAPCFLDGMSKYHTIPHSLSCSEERQCFEGGRIDTLVPSGVSCMNSICMQ